MSDFQVVGGIARINKGQQNCSEWTKKCKPLLTNVNDTLHYTFILHITNICKFLHVPATSLYKKIWTVVYKNLTYFAPIQSIVQMNGLSSSPNPAITGWQKYGPNLKSKRANLSSL